MTMHIGKGRGIPRRSELRMLLAQTQARQSSTDFLQQATDCLLKNTTEANWPAWSTVAITGALSTPEDPLSVGPALNLALAARLPSAEQPLLAILQEPINAGSLGRARYDGVSIARISGPADQPRAAVQDNQSTLRAGGSGPFLILDDYERDHAPQERFALVRFATLSSYVARVTQGQQLPAASNKGKRPGQARACLFRVSTPISAPGTTPAPGTTAAPGTTGAATLVPVLDRDGNIVRVTLHNIFDRTLLDGCYLPVVQEAGGNWIVTGMPDECLAEDCGPTTTAAPTTTNGATTTAAPYTTLDEGVLDRQCTGEPKWEWTGSCWNLISNPCGPYVPPTTTAAPTTTGGGSTTATPTTSGVPTTTATPTTTAVATTTPCPCPPTTTVAPTTTLGNTTTGGGSTSSAPTTTAGGTTTNAPTTTVTPSTTAGPTTTMPTCQPVYPDFCGSEVGECTYTYCSVLDVDDVADCACGPTTTAAPTTSTDCTTCEACLDCINTHAPTSNCAPNPQGCDCELTFVCGPNGWEVTTTGSSAGPNCCVPPDPDWTGCGPTGCSDPIVLSCAPCGGVNPPPPAPPACVGDCLWSSPCGSTGWIIVAENCTPGNSGCYCEAPSAPSAIGSAEQTTTSCGTIQAGPNAPGAGPGPDPCTIPDPCAGVCPPGFDADDAQTCVDDCYPPPSTTNTPPPNCSGDCTVAFDVSTQMWTVTTDNCLGSVECDCVLPADLPECNETRESRCQAIPPTTTAPPTTLPPTTTALGACCFPDGSCSTGSSDTCAGTVGGTFQGAGTNCSPNLCPQPTTTLAPTTTAAPTTSGPGTTSGSSTTAAPTTSGSGTTSGSSTTSGASTTGGSGTSSGSSTTSGSGTTGGGGTTSSPSTTLPPGTSGSGTTSGSSTTSGTSTSAPGTTYGSSTTSGSAGCGWDGAGCFEVDNFCVNQGLVCQWDGVIHGQFGCACR